MVKKTEGNSTKIRRAKPAERLTGEGEGVASWPLPRVLLGSLCSPIVFSGFFFLTAEYVACVQTSPISFVARVQQRK